MSSTPARSSISQLDYSILQQCIHCGLCLPTCPTYDATKHETSSPRGRIALMRAVADGKLLADSRQFAEELYFCLGCLACETACPAGVNYAEMLECGRAEVGLAGGRLLRWLFAKPARLRAVAKLLRVKIPSSILPGRLRELYELRPRISEKFSFELIRAIERPATVRYRVGLLTGCVQDVAFAEVNRDTVDVLLAAGCEVVTPRAQVCCGSVLGHNGQLAAARELARQNLAAFPLEELDAVISNAAGCGSFMKRHRHLLPAEPRAKLWDAKVRDIHEWLDGKVRGSLPPVRVAYHDACHLAHGQKISRQPRELLRAIAGVELVELPEASWCCGSAGLYNLTQPAMSRALLERKMKHIASTGAAVVVAGNPGCINQLRYGVKKFGVPVEVLHPITLLARACRAATQRQSQSDST